MLTLENIFDILRRVESVSNSDPAVYVAYSMELKKYIVHNLPNDKELLDQISKFENNTNNPRESPSLKFRFVAILHEIILKGQIQQIAARVNDIANNRLFKAENELNGVLQNALELQENLNTEKAAIIDQNKILKEDQEILKEFKKKLAISEKAKDFETQSDNNIKHSRYWAIAASVLIIGLVTYLILGFNARTDLAEIITGIKGKLANEKDVPSSLISNAIYISFYKHLFAKLLLFSMVVYAIVFCVKNYNAQMHNHVINFQKANALNATVRLLNTARSDEGSDKILSQASQAIFAHQNTGYQGKESEPANPNLVTNVIESVSKKI